MYQNTIYISISWYSKICWFLVKKSWCQQNSSGVSRDSYIFWIVFGWGITVPNFIVGYLWQILEREGLFAPLPPSPAYIREQPRKSPSGLGLRQIEWWVVLNGFITKNGVLPLTTAFVWKLINSCFNVPFTQVSIVILAVRVWVLL